MAKGLISPVSLIWASARSLPSGRNRREDVGDLQPREVECLARRSAGHRAAFELFAERGERRIAKSRHHQLAVYLVGHDHDVVAQAQLPDAAQLRGRPDPSDRVMRVAEEHQLHGRVGGFTLQVVEINRVGVVAVYQRAFGRLASAVVDRGEKWL